MYVLALETSAKAASCALMSDGALVAEFFTNAGLTHSQTIMPMTQSLLDHARVSINDIDIFAVSVGPGSFTGLRIGISAAKGMAVAAGKPCAPVPTLEALAHNLADFPGYVVPVMDARREQVYAAVFKGDGHGLARVFPDDALAVTDLSEKLKTLAPAPIILVGDGAELCHRLIADKLPGLLIASENIRHQRASSVCAVAQKLAQNGGLVTAEELSPVYLRLPQAERERLERGG